MVSARAGIDWNALNISLARPGRRCVVFCANAAHLHMRERESSAPLPYSLYYFFSMHANKMPCRLPLLIRPLNMITLSAGIPSIINPFPSKSSPWIMTKGIKLLLSSIYVVKIFSRPLLLASCLCS
jgi:hypothetical protein